MALTGYKVGDIINDGSNTGYYLKVKTVYPDGDIDVSVHAPTGMNEYRYASNGGSWMNMTNGGNHHISDNGSVSIQTVKYTYETKWVQPWSYYGNKQSSTKMLYGRGPTTYTKGSTAGPTWDDWVTKLEYVKGIVKSDWAYVNGTFQWGTTTSQGDWSGWYDGRYQDRVSNGWARPIKYQIKAKKPTKTTKTVQIKISKIGTPDTTRPDITIYDRTGGGDIPIPEKPGEYNKDSSVKIYWKVDSKFNYEVSGGKYTNLDGNTSNMNFSNNQVLTNYGTYEFTVKATNKETPSIYDTATVVIIIEDPYPPEDFIIYDKVTPSIIYDMSNKVYLGPQYPTITPPPKTTVISSLLNENSYTLGDAVVENGVYTISVTVRKSTNGKTLTKTGMFTIDNVPPDPPIIDVKDGNLYQGKDYGLVGRFPNPVTAEITVQSGAQVVDRKVWFRPHLWSTEWVEITPTSNMMTFTNKGIYKITARARKLSNGLYSDYTTVEVYKKIKNRYTITLNPNDYCYRTIATVNFPPDPMMKYQYKLGDGEWRWYRDPVKIYENTIMQVRSLDGDDNYESYITTKVIDIIDKAPPEPPKIGGVTEGAIGTSFVPTIIE
jgi:hypothetical protein